MKRMIANNQNHTNAHLQAFRDDSNSMESLTPLAHVGPDFGDENKKVGKDQLIFGQHIEQTSNNNFMNKTMENWHLD